MGNNEEGKSSTTTKSDKSCSPAPPEQTNIHVYPDWAAMQAYYGPRMAMPPYYNSPVASGHTPPPYMWGPQHMMPPYGSPYAAMYAHGGVYAHHPGVPLSQGQGVPSSPAVATTVSVETPSKSGNADRGLMKKLKGFDGLAMSIGNGNANKPENGAERRLSSGETGGSSDGSDGNTTETDQTRRKRSREGTPTIGNGKKDAASGNAASDKALNAIVKSIASGVSPGMTTAFELKNSPTTNAKSSPIGTPQPCSVLPPEVWVQNDREVKRERRKQSNRESARRSRLRKQAETEELARKVEALNAENMSLKSEINHLSEKSDTLKLENTVLTEKLKNAQLGQTADDNRAPAVSTENLLSRVSNSGSVDEEGRMYDSNAGAKLHQLLGTSPRADAVAAG